MIDMTDGRLTRLRWAARLTVMLGIVVSVTANVLHAEPNGVARGIAAWPPVALLIAFELVVRIPVGRAWLSWLRRSTAGTLAGIGAWLSYWHMVAVAARYGEHEHAAQYLIPLTVDGLVVVASICLVELAGESRRRAALVAVVDEPTDEPSAVEPAAVLNEAQLAAVALVDQLGLTADQLGEVAFYFAGDRDAEPWPWEKTPSVAPVSPGMGPVSPR